MKHIHLPFAKLSLPRLVSSAAQALFRRGLRLMSGVVKRAGRFVAGHVRLLWRALTGRYDRYARRYPFLQHLWVRVLLLVMAVLMLVSPLYLVTSQYLKDREYRMTTQQTALLGRSSVNTKFIRETDTAIAYNRADESSPKDLQQVMKLAGNKLDASGKMPYEANFPRDPAKGISFGESTGERTFTMVPQFGTAAPRLVQGRVLYPSGSNEKHLYTFKANGVKSDIVLAANPGVQSKTYRWKLQLDSSLEARMLPGGGIGIFSADPLLFGNTQTSSAKDKQLLESARAKASKDTLVFELPRPYVLDAQKHTDYTGVGYRLDGTTLTLQVSNLAGRPYPLTIDPTVVVTTTSDFQQKVGDTGNTDFSTADEIRRGLPGSAAVGADTYPSWRQEHASFVYGSYIYSTGGSDGGNDLDSVLRCPIGGNGNVGNCINQTNLIGARRNHAVAVNGNYFYITGGDNSTNLSDIVYCSLASDGAVQDCTTNATGFSVARSGHTSVVYNGYLYIIGGVGGSGAINTIQYCPINGNGSVGACTNNATGFTTARFDHTSVTYNGYLYIIGGSDISSNMQSDIQYCPINGNGSVGTCTRQTSMYTLREAHTSVVYNGYLYIIGGDRVSTYYDDVYYCQLQAGGSAGTCTQQTTVLPFALSRHSSVVYNGYLYNIFGSNSSLLYDGIQHCPLNGNGSVGTCISAEPSLNVERYGGGSAVYNGYMYAVGGGDLSTTVYNDIEYCRIEGIPVCIDQTNAFTTARKSFPAVAHNGYLYIIGGTNASGLTLYRDIQYCPLNSNGSVGACTQQATALPAKRSNAAAVVYNGYLYIIGGFDGSSRLSDILYCPLNANGSVGTCTTNATGFTTARSGHTAVAYNGYLYIAGGYGSGSLDDIVRCPLNPGGTVGGCTQQTAALTYGRYGHTSFIYNGYLYIIGGTNGSNYFDDIQYCPINTDASVGACTVQWNAFTTARYGHLSAVYDGYLYIVGGNNGANILWDIQTLQLGSLAPPAITQASAFTSPRAGHASVVYNGYLYIIGGSNATTVYSNIQRCPLAANGSIGTCTLNTMSFFNKNDLTAVVYNGYLYVAGGYDPGTSTYYDDIHYYQLNANGSVTYVNRIVGAFSPARAGHTSVVYNGYLYIIGGQNGTTEYNDIYYCPLNANGSVGTCTQQTNAFTNPREDHTSVVYNGYLYIIGGIGSINYNDIVYCPLNANGSVGTCTQQTNAFSHARSNHTSVVSNGYLYIIDGGYNDIQYCPLSGNGSIGTCVQQTGIFTESISGHASVVYNGFLYNVGGYTSSSGFVSSINYMQIGLTHAGLGAAAAQTGVLTSTRDGFGSAYYNGYIYVAGGYNGTTRYSDIQYCQVSGTYTVPSNCTNNATGFTTGRTGLAAAASGGYLYIIGGYDGTTYNNDIQYCQITGGGSVNACTQQTGVFPNGRAYHTAVVYNGYLYIAGGYNGTTYYNDIIRCPLNANGSVGSCTQQTSAFTTARAYHASVVYNGALYIIGGFDGTTYYNDIQYCPVSLTTFAVSSCTQKRMAFPDPRRSVAAAVYNGYLYITGGYMMRTAATYFNDIYACALSTTGAIDDCTQKPTAFTNARSAHGLIAAGGYLFLLGGSGAAGAYYSDIQRVWGGNNTPFTARYERVLDTGSAGNTLNGLIIDGSVPVGCTYTVNYKTADGTGVFGSYTTISGVQPSVRQFFAVSNKRYIFVAVSMDDTTCGSQSAITAITLIYNYTPGVPVLLQPAAGETGVPLLPEFRMGSTDDYNDYLRYSFDVCSDSACNTIVRTIDQTASQVGWTSQSTETGTAYTGANPLNQYAVHTYQASGLSANTQYWWRAKVLDPGAFNQWSAYSSIATFTTGSATPSQINVYGNSKVYSGSTLKTGP